MRDLNRLAWGFVVLRVFMGVLWLVNLSWKLPPDFGRNEPRGLLYSFRQAEQYAVGEPLRRFVSDVVIPHFSIFGWQVFLVEAVAGTLLLLGWHTRIGAVIGLLQSIAITALTMRAPNQWFWGFALFVAVSLLLVIVPANLRLSLDRRQGRA
ncbi:MAG: thiosulfate dehydrogenase (quinone) large subunit [Gaiellales bacterium]|nr:thiosulfate dehydrogenase (quinone) large subunit [Gaiellales bacterium]